METKDLVKVEWKEERVLTTEQLAQAYGCDVSQIKTNFNANKERFEEGKHYFKVEGEELKEFKDLDRVRNTYLVGKNARILHLWTRRGASRHCKMLGTDRAWEMFDSLEENYFNPRQHSQHKELTREERIAMALIEANELIKERDKQIAELAPKAEYTDHILNSNLLVNTSSIAKDFGMSAVTFNKLLHHFKIIYRHNNKGQWFVYQKYVDKGYAQSCTYKKTLDDGTTKELIYTKWTQAGKEFICNLLKEHKFIPVCDWAEYPAVYTKELKNKLKELGVLK